MKKNKHAPVDDDMDIEFEFARANKLKRLKAKAKKFSKRHDSVVVVTTSSKPDKPDKTYTVVKRKGKRVILRSSKGKVVKVSYDKYKLFVRKGKITGRLLPKTLPKALKEATTPPGFFAVQCGDDRVQIVYSISKDWEDLMCYHHRLKTTMHLKRKDLYPKHKVDEIIAFMQGLDQISPS